MWNKPLTEGEAICCSGFWQCSQGATSFNFKPDMFAANEVLVETESIKAFITAHIIILSSPCNWKFNSTNGKKLLGKKCWVFSL